MEHKDKETRYTRYDKGKPVTQPTIGKMLGILHEHRMLDHTEPSGDTSGERYMQLVVNDEQYYRGHPSIQLDYEDGTVCCWSPDADCPVWCFTYGDNDSPYGEPTNTEPWETYLPTEVCEAIKAIADQYNCCVYPMNL